MARLGIFTGGRSLEGLSSTNTSMGGHRSRWDGISWARGITLVSLSQYVPLPLLISMLYPADLPIVSRTSSTPPSTHTQPQDMPTAPKPPSHALKTLSKTVGATLELQALLGKVLSPFPFAMSDGRSRGICPIKSISCIPPERIIARIGVDRFALETCSRRGIGSARRTWRISKARGLRVRMSRRIEASGFLSGWLKEEVFP